MTDDYDCGGDDDAAADGEDNGAGDSPTNQSLTMQEYTALFLMVLRGKHKLTQVALQGIIGVTSLMHCHVDSLHTEVCQQLVGWQSTAMDSLECLFRRVELSVSLLLVFKLNISN